jgi:hypothetical protein
MSILDDQGHRSGAASGLAQSRGSREAVHEETLPAAIPHAFLVPDGDLAQLIESTLSKKTIFLVLERASEGRAKAGPPNPETSWKAADSDARMAPGVLQSAQTPVERSSGSARLTTTVTGTALRLISEIGTDMSRWPSEGHFASWLTLAPDNKISGGRLLSS